MKFAAVLLVALVAAVAAQRPIHLDNDYVEFLTREYFPRDYERVNLPRDSEFLSRDVTFTILLKQNNLKKLEDLFWKVSDPRHEMYGQYLTAEEIHTMTETAPEIREAVLDWVHSVFKTTGAPSANFEIIDRRDALKITAPVAVVEALFKTTLAPFKRTRGQQHNGRLWIKYVDTISVPKALEQHIDLITGIVEFAPIPQGVRVQEHKVRGTFDCNVPFTMKRMYSIEEDASVLSGFNASQAPYSEIGNRDEGFGESDLATFQVINGIPNNAITNIIGDDAERYTSGDTDTEAALDVQCLTGFGVKANTSFWVMNDWMYEYANEILNTQDPPLVNSMSYGWYESQQCRIAGDCTAHETSEDYVERTDVEFQKLGVMGITMLAASGDDGVESDKQCDEQRPDYPASSVYVTSVGATAVVSDGMDDPLGDNAPEVCTNDKYNCRCSTSNLEHAAMKSNSAGFDSGGGFSQWLAQPSYQKDAVEAYLNSGVALPDSQYYNATNRGYPDVSAVGAAVLIMKNGDAEKVGGTSASTPIWGGIISLLNSQRLAAGQPSLGFINPLLYQMAAQNPASFTDITVGTNGGGCANLAFDATTGWDPLTGLGTPVYSEISQYVANL
jgi:tripeptidyl-peptidase-1